MGCWDEHLFKCDGSHDQDGFQAHIWLKPSKLSFGTKRLMTWKLGKQHRILKYYQIYSNDDPGMTKIIFSNITSGNVFINSAYMPQIEAFEKHILTYFDDTYTT